jgi:putative N6-adenine-specific DNA methylase
VKGGKHFAAPRHAPRAPAPRGVIAHAQPGLGTPRIAPPAPVRPVAPASAPLRLFAAATPGLESALAAEVQALPGAREVTPLPGGVEFSGDLAVLYRANLWLRTASRVLLRMGELRALHFASLRRQIAQLPWERFAAGPVRVGVAATAHHCRLYHSGGVSERIALGLSDRGLTVRPESDPAAGPELHLVARGQDDVFTISLDTSGELLHRRGYRVHDTGAPLRETLAAGLLSLAGWDGTTPLLDPTCGSGTLVIEAALLATGRAPGRNRAFAFQSWPTYQAALWSALLAEADAAVRAVPPGLLHAADILPAAVAVARHNAERAGVESLISWSVADLTHGQLPAGPPGLVLSNPPYGVRLGGPQLQRLYRDLGRLARRAPGWGLGVLTSDPRLASAAGPSQYSYPLYNGGLRVTLHVTAPRAVSAWPAPR